MTDALTFSSTNSLRMVTTTHDKLIADLSDKTLERYDLHADPDETHVALDLRTHHEHTVVPLP